MLSVLPPTVSINLKGKGARFSWIERSNVLLVALFEAAETKAADDGKTLFVASSSDRGLCGGIHSSVSKATRRLIEEKPTAELVVLGDKPKAQLQRTARENIVVTFNQIGKGLPTFVEASSIADVIKAQGVEFDSAKIVYNEFKSVIAYEANTIPVYSEEVFKSSRKWNLDYIFW